MKKMLLLLVLTFFAVGCSKEKANLEELLTEEMRKDKDHQDYKLPPEEMASCVLEKIDKKIPGFLIGPKRDEYYSAYIVYLKSKTSKETITVINESVETFGSEEKARNALLAISDHVMDCMGMVMPDNETG